MVNEKFLQNDCLRTFSPISQKLKFSQIWSFCNNIPNSTNSVKILYQSFHQIQKKPVFDPFLVHFTNFRSINHSSGIPGSVIINLIEENKKKNSDPSGRKNLERKNDSLHR